MKILKRKRNCPICLSNINKTLFTQVFASGLTHEIVACSKCSFVFVSNTPNQKEYNQYYKVMSKYELERDQLLHEEYRDIISNYFPKSSAILDIGCSTGHLLFLLKQAGYINISGIDPSPECKKIAWNKFRIKIDTSSISSFSPSKKYDVIILAMILEHLRDVKESLIRIDKLLNKKGFIFISVPDAQNFQENFEEAFGEFSAEHINFFSILHLFKLMEGYTLSYMRSDGKNIFSLWKKSEILEKSILKYVEISKRKLNVMKKAINKMPSRILVWGAGSLTQRLLETTDISKKVVKFIDSDKKLWGKKLNGIEIISPDKAFSYKEPILISSFRFKDEIYAYIKRKKLTNKVITF